MPELKSDILETRKFLKYRLQNDKSSFRGYESERRNILDLLSRTSQGESNSALLLGARGCGKTTVNVKIFFEIQKILCLPIF